MREFSSTFCVINQFIIHFFGGFPYIYVIYFTSLSRKNDKNAIHKMLTVAYESSHEFADIFSGIE